MRHKYSDLPHRDTMKSSALKMFDNLGPMSLQEIFEFVEMDLNVSPKGIAHVYPKTSPHAGKSVFPHRVQFALTDLKRDGLITGDSKGTWWIIKPSVNTNDELTEISKLLTEATTRLNGLIV